MPYEMVRCMSRRHGKRFTLAITGDEGCQSYNVGTCALLVELLSLRSSFSTLASARIIVALPYPLCVRKLVEYSGLRVADKSLPAANVLLSRSRLKVVPNNLSYIFPILLAQRGPVDAKICSTLEHQKKPSLWGLEQSKWHVDQVHSCTRKLHIKETDGHQSYS
jgi:hypothetical protein